MSKRVLGLSFGKKLFAHCSMVGRVLEIFQKIKKIQSSIIAQNRSQKCANVFWTCFRANLSKKFFCPVFPGGPGFRKFSKKWKKFKIPKVPKIFSKSVHTCFEHALWRFFWIFFAECSMQGFSVILDLKMWVQFYDTLLNRHSFFIHATVNKRNSTSDILDLKLWVQNPELKNMSSVCRTWKTWVQFSGLKPCGRDLEKIKEKKS